MSRVMLAGVGFDPLTKREVIDRIAGAIATGRGGRVITPNLDVLLQATKDDRLGAMLVAADLVVADGMPIVWACRLQGTPLPERVPGSDLVWALAEEAERSASSIFLLGGDPDVAERAAERLVVTHPRLRIAGTYCPPIGFERDQAELQRIDRALLDAAPDIVYVGLPAMKQERLIGALRLVLPRTWFLGVGISLSFISGDIARAPWIIQRAGLEWASRLVQEPRRLAARYLVHDLPFALRLFASAAGRRHGRQRRA